MRTLIRFSIIVLFLVLGLQAVTAQTSPTRLRLKQLELAPDSTEHVITSDTNRVAVWTKMDSILFGTHTGSLTAGRIPRATGTYTLSDGVLRDDGTLLALGGVTVAGYSFYDYSTGGWRLATGTTAQRPTAVTGAERYNTSNGTWEYYGASAWEIPVKSSTSTGLFTAGSVLFADANGRAAQDNTNFFFNDANNSLGVGTASPNSVARFHAYNNSNAASGIRIEQANAGTAAEAFFVLYNDVGYASAELFSSGFSNPGLRRQMLFITDANQTNGLGFATLTTAPINFRTNSDGSTNTRLSIAGAGTITASSPFVTSSTLTANGTSTFVLGASNYIKLQTNSGAHSFFQAPFGNIFTSINSRFNGSNHVYDATGAASFVTQNNAVWAFSAASSGTAGATITYLPRLVSTSTGVGVNISPSYTLHLSGTDAMMLTVGTTAQRPTAAAGLLRYNSTIPALEYSTASGWNTISTNAALSGTNNYMAKFTSSSTIGNSALTDDGTTLDYLVSSASDLLFRIWNTGAGTSKMRFVGSDNKAAKHQWTHTSGWTGAIDVSNNTANENNAYMRFAVRGASDTNTEAGMTAATKMTILGSGNVGIGITAPAYTLDVRGTDGIHIPMGTTAQRPASLLQGIIRVNTDSTKVEWYNGTAWKSLLSGIGSVGTMSSFTLAGSSGTPQAITDGNTATIEAGYGMTTTAAATDKVTVAADTTKLATLYDVTSIGNTLYSGNGTIATDRTVTIGSDKTLTISGTTPDLPGYLFTEEKGYSSDWDTWGNYRLIYTDDYFTNFVQGILNYDSTVFLRISAGDWVGDHFVSMQMDGAGNLSLTGLDDTGTSAGLNLSDNATVGGYGARLQGGAGIEFDTDTGGKFVYQVNNSTKATLDATGLGINDTSPEKSLDVGGMGKFRQLSGQDNSVTIGTNANAGTGRSASITDAHSSDVAGRISFTSGTTLTAGEWVTLTWATSFDNPPAVVLMPENANAASIVPYLYVVPSTTGCSIVVNVTGAPYEGLTFEFNYITIQGK